MKVKNLSYYDNVISKSARQQVCDFYTVNGSIRANSSTKFWVYPVFGLFNGCSAIGGLIEAAKEWGVLMGPLDPTVEGGSFSPPPKKIDF